MAWRDTLREAKTTHRERERGRELFLFSIASQISVLKLSSSALLKWWHDQSPPLPKKPLFPPYVPSVACWLASSQKHCVLLWHKVKWNEHR